MGDTYCFKFLNSRRAKTLLFLLSPCHTPPLFGLTVKYPPLACVLDIYFLASEAVFGYFGTFAKWGPDGCLSYKQKALPRHWLLPHSSHPGPRWCEGPLPHAYTNEQRSGILPQLTEPSPLKPRAKIVSLLKEPEPDTMVHSSVKVIYNPSQCFFPFCSLIQLTPVTLGQYIYTLSPFSMPGAQFRKLSL